MYLNMAKAEAVLELNVPKLSAEKDGVENHIRVSKAYLPQGLRVLIIDDFLANGAAASGLCDIVKQSGGTVCGIGVCVEKCFQPGRHMLESMGYKVVALAQVEGIDQGRLVVKD